MTTTTQITVDLTSKTATDIFTLNGIIINNVTISNGQITYNVRDGGSVSLTDLQTLLNQLVAFQAVIELNSLSSSTSSIGNANFSLNRNDNVNCSYTFTGGAHSVEDYSYDYSTKLCTIKKRTIAVTVSYSAWLSNLFNMQRYIKELNY